MRRIFIIILFFAVRFGVYAQDGVVHQLDSVEVDASKISSNITGSVPEQTFSRNVANGLGFVSVADAVKYFAGVNVRDYGGIGGMKTVSVRNLGAQHTAVSYDGITISDTQAGQIDIGRFSMDNIATLSLSLGQSSDQMQSARHYASGGVLSLNTEMPKFINRNYSFVVALRGGSFGEVSPLLHYWRKIGSHTVFSAFGEYMRADGCYPFTLTNGGVKTKEYRHNTDIYSWQGETNIYHTFRDSSVVQIKTYYYSSKRGLPGTVILYVNDSKETLWDENFFVQSSWNKNFDKKWKLRIRGKYNHSWNRYEDMDVKYTDGKQTDVNRQNEYYLSSTLGYEPISGFSLALAEDLSLNNLHNNIGYEVNSEPANPIRYSSLTAFSARSQNSRLLLDGNVVFTWMHDYIEYGDEPSNKHRISPSLSASYRILSNESLFLRAMFKSTFRVPSFNDLYYRRIGARTLVPEKALEYNLGVAWSKQISRQFKISTTVDGYYNSVHDKIVAFPTAYVWKMANFGRVHITGFDFTFGSDIKIADLWNASMTLSYTHQKAIDKTDKTLARYDSQIPYTPENNGGGTFMLCTPWFHIGYSVQAMGKRYSMPQNTSEYLMRAYWEHNVNVSREMKFHGCSLTLSLSVLNIGNEQYEIIQYYPMPGRSWQASATLRI